MDRELKRLFSGLIKDAGAKADEGKTLVKNAINKITQSNSLRPESVALQSSGTASSSEKKTGVRRSAATMKQPSAFQQNLLKLKQYEDAPSDDSNLPDSLFEMPLPINAVSDLPEPSTAQRKPSSERRPTAKPSPLSRDPVAPRAKSTRDRPIQPSLEPQKITRPEKESRTTVQTSALTEALDREKQRLADELDEWQVSLGNSVSPTSSASSDKSVVITDEALLDRLQTILDMIGGQIAQVQSKKDEIEAQKLLFDSTCSTMYREQESYRQAIETFTEQISKKHEELGNYLVQWESDAKIWSNRKAEIEGLRGKSLQAQRQYQESIADYVEQITERQQTLVEHQNRLAEQEIQWRNLSETIADLRADAENQQENYRQQIESHIEQLQAKQHELDIYMGDWGSRLAEWLAQVNDIHRQKDLWTETLSALQTSFNEASLRFDDEIDRVRQTTVSEKEDLSAWFEKQSLLLTQKESELTALLEDLMKTIDSTQTRVEADQDRWTRSIQAKLTEQQKWFDEEQSRLQTTVSQQINQLTEALAESNELYLTLYREHQRQLSEILAAQPDIVTESIWRNRLSFVIAFIPELPAHLSSDDLSVIFGGIEVKFKSPYIPPTEATTQVKWQLFERLPENERHAIAAVCKDIATNHRIESHPIAQSLLD